jgi:selenocysteine lyase/cysteine desulfurase
MDASVDFVLRVGPDSVLRHNRKLIELLFEYLPKDCVPGSPLDSAQRGPYGCFTGQTLEKTVELYKKLRKENVVVSMREGRIRVSPHLFNSEQDIDRLIGVVTARIGRGICHRRQSSTPWTYVESTTKGMLDATKRLSDSFPFGPT